MPRLTRKMFYMENGSIRDAVTALVTSRLGIEFSLSYELLTMDWEEVFVLPVHLFTKDLHQGASRCVHEFRSSNPWTDSPNAGFQPFEVDK